MRTHQYIFDEIDVILLEGIFIFKRAFASQFDLRIWLECSFETALERAVALAQEGLGPGETAEAYRSIFAPHSGYISSGTPHGRPPRFDRQLPSVPRV